MTFINNKKKTYNCQNIKHNHSVLILMGLIYNLHEAGEMFRAVYQNLSIKISLCEVSLSFTIF